MNLKKTKQYIQCNKNLKMQLNLSYYSKQKKDITSHFKEVENFWTRYKTITITTFEVISKHLNVIILYIQVSSKVQNLSFK